MTIMLKDLVDNSALREKVLPHKPGNHNGGDHPMDECFDRSYGDMGKELYTIGPGMRALRGGR